MEKWQLRVTESITSNGHNGRRTWLHFSSLYEKIQYTRGWGGDHVPEEAAVKPDEGYWEQTMATLVIADWKLTFMDVIKENLC